MAGDMSCPNCHQLDAVRNVQSVVSGQVSSGSFAGGFGGIAGGGLMGGAVGGKTGAATDLARRLAGPSAPVKSITLPLFVTVLAIPFAITALVGWKMGWVWAIVLLAAGVGLWVWATRRWQSAVTAWRPLRDRWASLLYCARCDMVWDPDRRQPVRPEQRGQLLLQPDPSLGGTRP